MQKRIAIPALLMLCLLPQPAGFAQDDPCTSAFGVYDPDRERCVFAVGLDMQIDLPVDVEADYPMMADALEEVVYSTATEFLDFFNKTSMFSSSTSWALQIEYEVHKQTPATPTAFSPEIVSVVFSIYTNLGIGEGTSRYQTAVYDVTNQGPLSLDDLLVAGTRPDLVALVREKLTVQLAGISDAIAINRGTREDSNDLDQFALTNDELIFFFDQHQVAPGAAGPQKLHIPLTELSGVLQPMYIPVR